MKIGAFVLRVVCAGLLGAACVAEASECPATAVLETAISVDTAASARPVGAPADTARAPMPGGPRSPAMPADTAAARADTAAARADTTASRARSLWTMDELKGLLDVQAGVGASKARSTRRGRTAMLCSLLVPGLGQMYNEKPLKAAIALGVETVYLSNILRFYRLADRREEERARYAPGTRQWRFHDAWVNEYNARVTDWIWWSGGTVLVIMLDAYVDAHLGDMNLSVEGAAVEGGGGMQIVVSF